jgi:hypothetical protein
MSPPLSFTLALAVVIAAAPLRAQSPAADSGAFVTRLGADTLALERFVRTAHDVEAEVVLRVPSTLRTRYRLELTPAGELSRMESVSREPRAPFGERRETISRAGDSLRVETTQDGRTRVAMVAAARDALPFIDMIHWPYEVALRRHLAAGRDSAALPLLTGSRVTSFRLARVAGDSATITHPLRGTMRARVDGTGRLLGLDAGATTRKLVVERGPWMPLDSAEARWAALDAAGRSLGALSGRGEARGALGGATFVIDYGTPARRGRDVWGTLVPWGQIWRTGANLATHVTTDRDLVLGAGRDTLVVPPGRYTLYTIPERDGGVLIVNRQTGQGGTTYDAARDLGRVPMRARALATPVESFTITASQDGTSGEIRLQWDRTELVVPVRVR